MTKVKGKDLAKLKHPNSRKTNALLKGIQKSKYRQHKKQAGDMKLNIIGEKVLWFRNNLETDCCYYTPLKTIALIQRYLARFDDELDLIKLKHSIGNRKNRQHANREDIINMSVKSETEEYNGGGLEIPDLLNVQQLNLLQNWGGELRFLQNFKLKRYSKKYLEEESKKPNKYNPSVKVEQVSTHKQESVEKSAIEMDIN